MENTRNVYDINVSSQPSHLMCVETPSGSQLNNQLTQMNTTLTAILAQMSAPSSGTLNLDPRLGNLQGKATVNGVTSNVSLVNVNAQENIHIQGDANYHVLISHDVARAWFGENSYVDLPLYLLVTWTDDQYRTISQYSVAANYFNGFQYSADNATNIIFTEMKYV